MFLKKTVFSPTRFSLLCNRISWKHRLKPHFTILPSLSQSAPYSDRYTLQKAPIDPRVEKLQDQLIYSEYVESKLYKLSYSEIKRKEQQMRTEEMNKKINNHLSTPAISVALKYLNATQVAKNAETDEKREQEGPRIQTPKPIYMPYAVEDKVEEVVNCADGNPKNQEEEQVEEEEEDDRILSANHKIAYDTLIEKTKNKNQQNFTNWRDDLSAVPPEWMQDYEIYDETKIKGDNEDPWMMKYGTPEPNSEITSVPCGGCGALLHCKDPEIPGYIPSELLIYNDEKELKSFICQRCHFMKNYNVALDVKVSAEDYPKLLTRIQNERVKTVILMVDLMDFPCCIWPNLQSVIGGKASVFLVGNKVDLLPQDSMYFFRNVKERMIEAAVNSGIKKNSIIDAALISAKTHFGIEELITKLFRIKKKGNIYLVGCTNVGKSSLFNALLQSDLCKVKAVDLVKRATVAPWPGTTLNLLKFPVTRSLGSRMSARYKRLIDEKAEKELELQLMKEQYRATRKPMYATLKGWIGRTNVKGVDTVQDGKITDIFNLNSNEDVLVDQQRLGLDENDPHFKLGSWCFDTPGTIQPDQILHLLTTEELLKTMPNEIIMPRSFVTHSNETIFLAGLGRLDILKCEGTLRVTVFASKELPVTIVKTENAKELYKELLRTDGFVVPVPDEERLKVWPELMGKDLEVTGVNVDTSAADILLSSAGWIAITPRENSKVSLRAWTPEGRGIYVRQPALLSKATSLRGARILKTPAYKRTKFSFGNLAIQ